MLRNYVIPCINDEPFWNLKWWEWKICLYVIFWPFYPIQISSVSRINVSVDFIYLRRIFGQIPTFSNNFVGRVSLGNKSWSSASNYQRKSSSLSVEVWSAWGKVFFLLVDFLLSLRNCQVLCSEEYLHFGICLRKSSTKWIQRTRTNNIFSSYEFRIPEFYIICIEINTVNHDSELKIIMAWWEKLWIWRI